MKASLQAALNQAQVDQQQADSHLTVLTNYISQLINAQIDALSRNYNLSTKSTSVLYKLAVTFCQSIIEITPLLELAVHTKKLTDVKASVDKSIKKLNAIRLLDIIQVVDVGTPINRMTVAGQIEGGIAQGVGYALYERMEINPRSKRTMSSDLLHYRIPQMDDMPKTHVDMVDSYDPYGPHGAKSVGELTTVPVAPAIVNAVRHASGQELNSLPLCDKFIILPSRRKEEE